MADLAPVPVREGLTPLFDAARVPLGTIDAGDETFLVRHGLESEELAASVAQEGVLVPLWLARRGERLIIVDGFRRLAAARACNAGELPALVFGPGVRGCDLWRRVLVEKCAQGSLDVFERATFLAKLQSSGEIAGEELARRWAPALGFPANAKRWPEMLAVLEIPSVTRARLIKLGIADRAVHAYARLKGEEESFFYSRYLRGLAFNTNELAQALDGFEALRRTRVVPLAELLQTFEPEVGKKTDGKAAVGELLGSLAEAREPALTRARARVSGAREKLRLPKGVSLSCAPSFEESGFRLTLDLKSPQDWKAKKAWLDAKADEMSGVFDALP